MVPHTGGDSAVVFGCIEAELGELAGILLADDGRSGIVAAAGRMRWMAELGGVAERIGHCAGQGEQQCRQERWAEHCNARQKEWVRQLLRVREGRHFPQMDRCESMQRWVVVMALQGTVAEAGEGYRIAVVGAQRMPECVSGRFGRAGP